MELRQYWQIIWKRIWIPIFLVALVAGLSLLTAKPRPATYTTSLRFIAGVKTQPAPPERLNEETFHAWVASEYLADDLSVFVGSQEFASDVNRHLVEMGSRVQIFPGSLAGMTVAEKEHRILQVRLAWGNPGELAEIGRAVVSALIEDSPKYFAQMGTEEALITVIDQALVPVLVPPSLTQRLDLPVRLLIALAAGIALTFLLDYLDTSVRNGPELEAMGISVLAEVPKHK
jgi:capsular polysaccharide biosynthesis protein